MQRVFLHLTTGEGKILSYWHYFFKLDGIHRVSFSGFGPLKGYQFSLSQSLNRVRVQEPSRHTPFQNSREYPHPPRPKLRKPSFFPADATSESHCFVLRPIFFANLSFLVEKSYTINNTFGLISWISRSMFSTCILKARPAKAELRVAEVKLLVNFHIAYWRF